MRRLVLLAVLAALAGVLAPPTAGARVLDETTIVPGRAIGLATVLGARVRIDERIGVGQFVKRVRTPIGRLSTYRYAAHAVDVTYRAGTAVAILTKNGRYGTKKGIGVGATKADLRRAYPSLRCPTATLCTLGELRPGARVTDFRLAKGTRKVVSVLVGAVLD